MNLKEIVEKNLKKYDLHIISTDSLKKSNQNRIEPFKFQIVKYYNEHCDDLFLQILHENSNLPLNEKNKDFGFFTRIEMKGFKKNTLLSFVKNNNSISDFNNAFQSFFKFYSPQELFDTFYIKSNWVFGFCCCFSYYEI